MDVYNEKSHKSLYNQNFACHNIRHGMYYGRILKLPYLNHHNSQKDENVDTIPLLTYECQKVKIS